LREIRFAMFDLAGGRVTRDRNDLLSCRDEHAQQWSSDIPCSSDDCNHGCTVAIVIATAQPRGDRERAFR
jgi:hypothetical protein